ncbi:33954_t:CDS:2, partial [Gigaspora margarita]
NKEEGERRKGTDKGEDLPEGMANKRWDRFKEKLVLVMEEVGSGYELE